jgi:hypothetical protein
VDTVPPHAMPDLPIWVARLCRDVYGDAETEEALADVLGLDDAQIAHVMRGLRTDQE